MEVVALAESHPSTDTSHSIPLCDDAHSFSNVRFHLKDLTESGLSVPQSVNPMSVSVTSFMRHSVADLEKTFGVPIMGEGHNEGDEAEEERDGEAATLSAIYGDGGGGENFLNFLPLGWSIPSQALPFSVRLCFLFPAACRYPHQVPVFVVLSDGRFTNTKECVRFLYEKAKGMVGSPFAFEIFNVFEEWITHNTKNGKLSDARSPLKLSNGTQQHIPLVRDIDLSTHTSQGGPSPSLSSSSTPVSPNRSFGPSNQKPPTHGNTRHAKYPEMQHVRARLPAYQHRDLIIESIHNHQVVVITGHTGCGKSTQIPQYILDDMIDKGAGKNCNIVCTQPRRVAAMGVASRVAEERCEVLGGTVGYVIRMESVRSADTRITFCTVGVLLRLLLSDPLLDVFSHVIVDEVHERSVEIDYLLLVLRRLCGRRPGLKVILMSATVTASQFVEYFHQGSDTSDRLVTPLPPIHEIAGRTFNVTEYFVEDVLQMSQYPISNRELLKKSKLQPSEVESSSSSSAFLNNESENYLEESEMERPAEVPDPAMDRYSRFNDDVINHRLIVHVTTWIHTQQSRSLDEAVLIFLPGSEDIYSAARQLSGSSSGASLHVLPLHSSLPAAAQKEVFRPPPSGKRKVILATNVAETSVTIDDVVYVIDLGRVKQTEYDAESQITSLKVTWAAWDALLQRKGRAGRVKEGICFRLFSKRRSALLPRHTTAEIHRTALDRVCLDILASEWGDPAEVRRIFYYIIFLFLFQFFL